MTDSTGKRVILEQGNTRRVASKYKPCGCHVVSDTYFRPATRTSPGLAPLYGWFTHMCDAHLADEQKQARTDGNVLYWQRTCDCHNFTTKEVRDVSSIGQPTP